MYLYGCKLESDYMSIVISDDIPGESRVSIFYESGRCDWEWVTNGICSFRIDESITKLIDNRSGNSRDYNYSYSYIISCLKEDDRDSLRNKLPDWFISNLVMEKLQE